MSFCGSKAGVETPAPLVNNIVNKALIITALTSMRRCINSFTSCTLSGRLVAELCRTLLDWGRCGLAATNL